MPRSPSRHPAAVLVGPLPVMAGDDEPTLTLNPLSHRRSRLADSRVDAESTLDAVAPLSHAIVAGPDVGHAVRGSSIPSAADHDRTLPDVIVKIPDAPHATDHDRTLECAAPRDPRVARMEKLLETKQLVGALDAAEEILADDPDSLDAKECRLRCEVALEADYARRFGSMARVPRVSGSHEQVMALGLDGRLGFVLSRIDGVASIEMLLDGAGIRPLDVMRGLFELIEGGVVSLGD